MISNLIGRLFQWPRERIARGLLRLGLGPNHITVLGMLFTVAAGVAIAADPAYWHTWAVGFIIASGACDLLDGSMAKLGNRTTRFGAVLDSSFDRIGDAALFLGPAVYFLAAPGAAGGQGQPNLTLGVLAGVGLTWAYLISYIKARAENVGVAADGGFWQRPERIVTILLALGFHHVTTAVWILGTLPLTTVIQRLWQVRRTADAAPGAAANLREPGLPLAIAFWRWPRGSIPFDVYAGSIVAMCVFLDIPAADPLRDWVARWVGA